MAKNTNNKCKVCRRAGEKLFLKGEKCFTPKCVFNKKPYAPGKLDSQRKHRSQLTEYGKQLKEKQKVRNTYGMREKQFSNYIKEATAAKEMSPADTLYQRLESRLDNVVYRLGLASSRPLSRQLVSHGHITVNGRKVTVPSYKLKKDDIIGVREGSKSRKVFEDLDKRLEKSSSPAWMLADPSKLEGKMVALPSATKAEIPFDLAGVIEFYSR